MYSEKDLVRIAKRENNNKRKYLVVNRLQGKHMPVKPGECLEMFDALAGIAAEAFGDENILLVGFAETATAIGARLAAKMDCYYMQTTREEIEGAEYFYFTESHSHAAQQKLVKTDLDKVMEKVSRVVFVEDEVTTGNTILGIAALIRKAYGEGTAFAVISILNGMDGEAEEIYARQGISLYYLVKTDHSGYTGEAEKYRGDGVYYGCPLQECRGDGAYYGCSLPGCRGSGIYREDSAKGYGFREGVIRQGDSGERISGPGMYRAEGYRNARRLVKGGDYQAACEMLYGQARRLIPFAGRERVLVLGTEEFMYPAIYAASKLEKEGYYVKCHSTTRSPIAVSTEEGYPLRERYELHSPYEYGRRTFIYDLQKYDKAVIFTDARGGAERGLGDLCRHLRECGNDKIYVVRWCG